MCLMLTFATLHLHKYVAGESLRTNMRDARETNSGDTPGITHLRLLKDALYSFYTNRGNVFHVHINIKILR